ncbi:Sporulation inhibitor A [Halalkalibacter krulwichiae]|uniref:Sporulation inhibitor A n=1 Tax=Halalkalibacter krulwichiae TaxID=199441 RepID=A0A1X9MEH0_9BACI|nr:Sporulation inhibitor A [Halalkalibacter krulwichiae]
MLIEAYERAVELDLEDDFIQLLKEEISERENKGQIKKRISV